MKNPWLVRANALVLPAALLAVAAAGCTAYNAGAPVKIVRDATVVSGCQKVTDVSVGRKTADGDINTEVAEQAREKGGDTVVLEAGSRSGAAYRCESPSPSSGAVAKQ